MIYKRYTKAGKTRWVVKVYTGTNPDGKKVDKHVGTFGSAKEAKQADARALKQYAGTNGNETVGEYAERWLRDYPRPRASTNRTHGQAVRAFVAAYRTRQPQTITKKEARAWALAHPSSHAALRAMWSDMGVEEIVAANPWSNLRLPQSQGRANIIPPTAADLRRLRKTAVELKGDHGPQYAAMIDVAAYTGIRRGELCALTWADIDFQSGRVVVSKTLSNDSEVLPPKNGKPRSVVLPPRAATALRGLARPLDAGALVFTTPNGKRYSKSTWHYHWNPVRVAAGLPDLDWHVLRHYCATYMIDVLNLSPRAAAKQLGHSDAGELVMRLYAHPDDDKVLDEVKEAFDREHSRPTSLDEARRNRRPQDGDDPDDGAAGMLARI